MDQQTKMQSIIDDSFSSNDYIAALRPLINRIVLWMQSNLPVSKSEEFLHRLERMRIVSTVSLNAPVIATNFNTMEMRINPNKINNDKPIDPEYLIATEFFRFINPSEDVKAIVIGNAAGLVGSQHLAANEGEFFYTNEQIITNLLARVLSDTTIIELCVNNHREALAAALMAKNIPVEMFKDFLVKANYMHENIGDDNEQIFNELQTTLIDMFYLSPRTKEETTSLEANLLGPDAIDYYLAKTTTMIPITNEPSKTMAN